jgi:hypothetical protein
LPDRERKEISMRHYSISVILCFVIVYASEAWPACALWAPSKSPGKPTAVYVVTADEQNSECDIEKVDTVLAITHDLEKTGNAKFEAMTRVDRPDETIQFYQCLPDSVTLAYASPKLHGPKRGFVLPTIGAEMRYATSSPD